MFVKANRFALIFIFVANSFTPVFGALVLSNGGFDTGVSTSFDDIASSAQVVTGNWLTRSSTSPNLRVLSTIGPTGTNSNVLFHRDSNTGTATTFDEQAAFQFIDAAGESGTYRLDFDFFRNKNGGSAFALGNLNVQVYGIEDTGLSGWTTSSPFDLTFITDITASPAPYPTPILNDARLTVLGGFETGSLNENWRQGFVAFDLGSGTQYDQIVIKVGSRLTRTAFELHAFDNFTLTSTATAIPEPSSLAFLSFGLVSAGWWRLGRRRKDLLS